MSHIDSPQASALSPTEARFEVLRKRAGLVLAPIAFAIIVSTPLPELTPQAHRLAALVGLIGCLWITEAIPLALTGLLAPLLMIILGIAPASDAFAPFADPIMFLFIGAFILARSIQLHGLDRRFAYVVLTRRWVGESPGRILFAFGAICCVISMWISNTATVAMMFPIGIAIIRMLGRIDRTLVSGIYPSALMLMCAFAAAIGGLATPVGTPTNLIGLGFIERQLGQHISFFQWMSFSVPMVVVLFLLLFVYLNFLGASGLRHFPGVREMLVAERSRFGDLAPGERNTLIAFGLTVVLWITPGVLALALGDRDPLTLGFSRHVPESVAALLGAVLLFFLPVDREKGEYTLNLKSALDIDWGVLAMYGGGIALGQMVFETKLAETIGTQVTSSLPLTGLTMLVVASALAILASEFTSNVSSANMIVPLVIALAGAGAIQPAIAATMAASLGFMLPISTPTNAIVYSSGYIPLVRMVKYGVLLDVIGLVVIVVGTELLVPA